MEQFRKKYPIAWHFHKNTNRSIYHLYNPLDSQPESPLYGEYPKSIFIPLEKTIKINTKILDCLNNRYSCRNFVKSPINIKQIATILNFSYGISKKIYINNLEFFKRFTPSGGALYPIEIYLIIRNVEGLKSGLYHYTVLPPGLEQLKKVELPDNLISSIFMNQFYISNAAVILIATSILERTMWKYGDRGYRYILMESGHLFQNINLISSALNLGSLNLGGFFDEEVSSLFNLDTEYEIPIYAMAVGVPGNEVDNNVKNHK